jgi:cytosine/uracil/thiamine/allantoin permease
MKRRNFVPLALLVLLTISLSGCAAIEGIFKAGVWSGVIICVLILALIIWLISKIFGGGKN